jgi:hypothetical protein
VGSQRRRQLKDEGRTEGDADRRMLDQDGVRAASPRLTVRPTLDHLTLKHHPPGTERKGTQGATIAVLTSHDGGGAMGAARVEEEGGARPHGSWCGGGREGLLLQDGSRWHLRVGSTVDDGGGGDAIVRRAEDGRRRGREIGGGCAIRSGDGVGAGGAGGNRQARRLKRNRQREGETGGVRVKAPDG